MLCGGGLVIKLCPTLATYTCSPPDSSSMSFLMQECWNGLPFPFPGGFLTQGMNLTLLNCKWNEVKVAQPCPTLCDRLDNTVHGILHARILEWVVIPFSGDLPNRGINSRSPALQADSLPAKPPGKPFLYCMEILNWLNHQGMCYWNSL